MSRFGEPNVEIRWKEAGQETGAEPEEVIQAALTRMESRPPAEHTIEIRLAMDSCRDALDALKLEKTRRRAYVKAA